MLSNEQFVRLSLELNLFFLRIMKEHSFFIEADLTRKNVGEAREADAFKNEFTRLLAETTALADGHISPDALNSGEFVSNYTIQAERASEFFTAIPIDSNVTRAELAIGHGGRMIPMPLLVQRVAALNQRAIIATARIIQFKGRLYRDVTTCRAFSHSYPLLIDHIRREAIFFVEMLNRLQRRDDIDIVRDALEQESFWNRIMAEHSKFIRGLLDPTEEQLFETANNFGKEFDQLVAEAAAAQNNPSLLPRLTDESLRATTQLRDFKRQGTQGILECKVKSIILPLLADHTLREANHFLRILRTIERIR